MKSCVAPASSFNCALCCIGYTMARTGPPANASYICVKGKRADPRPALVRREQQMGGSAGDSLEPPGPLLEPPAGPLLTHLHTVYMAYSERLPTRLNPLAKRTCFSQARPQLQLAARGRVRW
jgi:hypothetical protein